MSSILPQRKKARLIKRTSRFYSLAFFVMRFQFVLVALFFVFSAGCDRYDSTNPTWGEVDMQVSGDVRGNFIGESEWIDLPGATFWVERVDAPKFDIKTSLILRGAESTDAFGIDVSLLYFSEGDVQAKTYAVLSEENGGEGFYGSVLYLTSGEGLRTEYSITAGEVVFRDALRDFMQGELRLTAENSEGAEVSISAKFIALPNRPVVVAD